MKIRCKYCRCYIDLQDASKHLKVHPHVGEPISKEFKERLMRAREEAHIQRETAKVRVA